jgi:4-amino-4-deoxy-L-arabinose transferase-like glycosyltransferase
VAALTALRHPAVHRTLLVSSITVWLALGALWLWQLRRGQPVDIDEAGYLGIAITDGRSLADGGLAGFWDAVMAPSIQAPLMTGLTGVLFAVAGPGVLTGLQVPLAMGGVMLLAAYCLGHEVGGPRAGWVTLAVTSGTPVVIGFSRSYNFAIAAGASTAVMLWVLARSRSLERPGWAALTGVAVGMVALSRTMTVAFLPAVGIAAVVMLAVGPHRGRRAFGVAIMVGTALLVAGPWYWRNGDLVLDYLTSYGYGRSSRLYGDDQSPFALDSWRATLDYVLSWAGLPMVLVWLVAAVVVLVEWIRAGRREGVRAALLRAARSPLMPSVVWLLWSLAALTSSGNKGSGFLTPLVPAFAVVTAVAVCWLPRHAARGLAAAVVAVLLVNTVVSADPGAHWAQQRQVPIPWVGRATVVSGDGVIQGYTGGQLSGREARAWRRALDRLAVDQTTMGPGEVLTVYGFRHRLVNVNSVQLHLLLTDRRPGGGTMVDPASVPNEEQEMTDYLTTGAAGSACLLLTSRGRSSEFEPIVDAELMARAGREAGFVRSDTIELPDHRTVVVWRRPATCPATDAAGAGA